MPSLEEIGQKLVDGSVGTALFDDVWPGKIPASPDDVYVVIPTGGDPPVDTFGSAGTVSRPTFQIYSRAVKWTDARDNADAAWTALHGVKNVTLQGARGGVTTEALYHHIRCVNSEPMELQPDESKRFVFVFNIEVQKQASSVV